MEVSTMSMEGVGPTVAMLVDGRGHHSVAASLLKYDTMVIMPVVEVEQLPIQMLILLMLRLVEVCRPM
jgi:hypothetical protein